MKSQKEMKKLYSEDIKKIWTSENMQKYCIQKASVFVPLGDGYAVIEKPTIKTRFYFGVGQNATATDEEMQKGLDCEELYLTKSKYFLEDNLHKIETEIAIFEDTSTRKFKFDHYEKCREIKGVTAINRYNEQAIKIIKSYDNCIEMTTEEVDKYILGLYEAKAKFEKRLNSYLKRYGLSKIETMSYIID